MKPLAIGVTVVLILAAVAAYFAFFSGTPLGGAPFDPDTAASEIQARIGSGPTTRNFTTSIICSGAMADLNKVCTGHRLTAHEVRTHVDQVIRGTDAKATSTWTSAGGGYTRSWRYGESGFQLFSIIIMSDAITIDW